MNGSDEGLAAARAWPCGVEGCDGSTHTDTDAEASWVHLVRVETADEGRVRAAMTVVDGVAAVEVDFRYEEPGLLGSPYYEMDGPALRALAERFDGLPGMLHALAAEVDRRNDATQP